MMMLADDMSHDDCVGSSKYVQRCHTNGEPELLITDNTFPRRVPNPTCRVITITQYNLTIQAFRIMRKRAGREKYIRTNTQVDRIPNLRPTYELHDK